MISSTRVTVLIRRSAPSLISGLLGGLCVFRVIHPWAQDIEAQALILLAAALVLVYCHRRT
jgi:hypothetical protein